MSAVVPPRCRSAFPELFAWVHTGVIVELHFEPNHILFTASVQQGDPFGPFFIH